MRLQAPTIQALLCLHRPSRQVFTSNYRRDASRQSARHLNHAHELSAAAVLGKLAPQVRTHILAVASVPVLANAAFITLPTVRTVPVALERAFAPSALPVTVLLSQLY